MNWKVVVKIVVNYFWTLSKMAEKSRDRSCSEPSNYMLDQGKKFYQISLSILISCLLDNVPYNDVVERSYKSLTSRSKRAKMFLLWKIIDSLSFLSAVKGVRGCEKKKKDHSIASTRQTINLIYLSSIKKMRLLWKPHTTGDHPEPLWWTCEQNTLVN